MKTSFRNYAAKTAIYHFTWTEFLETLKDSKWGYLHSFSNAHYLKHFCAEIQTMTWTEPGAMSTKLSRNGITATYPNAVRSKFDLHVSVVVEWITRQ